MKNLLFIACIALTGCAQNISEDLIESDFRKIISSEYSFIFVKKIERITYGDGWDGAAEVRVYFDGSCTVDQSTKTRAYACTEGKRHLQMSYQMNEAGNWKVLSYKLADGQ